MSSKSKKTEAASPPARPAPTDIGKFSIDDGIVCKLIRVHGKSEGPITTEELIARGEAAGADMGWEDGDNLFRHRNNIPSEFPETIIVFPNWNSKEKDGEDDKTIRGLDNRGVNWWCVQAFPLENTWESNCVLMVYDVLYLPPGKDE